MTDSSRSLPDELPYRSPAEGFLRRSLTLLFLILALIAGLFFAFNPETFLITLPVMAIASLSFAYGFFAVVKDPPPWFASALIVLAFAMMDLNFHTGTGEAATSFQSVGKGLIWLFVMFFGVIRSRGAVFESALTILLLIYALLGLASAAYAPSVMLALGSGISLLAVATYAAVIGKMKPTELAQLWIFLYWATVLIAMLSLIAYLVLPGWAGDLQPGGGRRLQGITGSANSLGPIAALGVILSIYYISLAQTVSRRVLIIALLGIFLLTLGLTQSRGAIVGLAGAYLIQAAIIQPFAPIALGLVVIMLVWLTLQPAYLQWLVTILTDGLTRSGKSKELLSMTGRTDLWSAIVPKWLERPWFGFGLGAPRTAIPDAYSDIWGNTQQSAHNWILESLLSVGIIGTLVLLTFILLLGFRAWGLQKRLRKTKLAGYDKLAVCMLRCILFLFVSGMVEKGFAGTPNPGTALLAILAGTIVALRNSGDDVTDMTRAGKCVPVWSRGQP